VRRLLQKTPAFCVSFRCCYSFRRGTELALFKGQKTDSGLFEEGRIADPPFPVAKITALGLNLLDQF